MKKRKKDTGLSLQASISEKEKRTVTSGFLAIVPVCYMILGVFGWMKTALGIINVVYDADLLYGVLLAAGIWMGILYLMKKRQFLLAQKQQETAPCIPAVHLLCRILFSLHHSLHSRIINFLLIL